MSANIQIGPTCKCCGFVAADSKQVKFGRVSQSIFNYTAEFFECKRCRSCFYVGLDEHQIAEFYRTNESGYVGNPQFAGDDVVNKNKYAKYIHFTGFFLSRPGGSVCDIGCGGGGFLLSLLEAEKYDALVGIDYDVSDLTIKYTDPKIQWLNNLSDVTRKFDLITAFHVLEHVVDIDSFLEQVKKIMHADSTLIIEVPNKANYNKSVQGMLYWLAIQEHLNHFTESGMKLLFSRHGMEVVGCIEYDGLAPNCPYPALLIAARFRSKNTEVDDYPEVFVSEVNRCCEQLTLLATNSTVVVWGLSQLAALCISNVDEKAMRAISLIDNGNVGAFFQGIEIIPSRGPIFDDEILLIFESTSKQNIWREATNLGWSDRKIHIVS